MGKLSFSKQDPEILCWDLRKPGQILYVAVRKVETNQRIYFDWDRYIQMVQMNIYNIHLKCKYMYTHFDHKIFIIYNMMICIVFVS